MKFKRVLREALRFWPSRMAISAGKLVAGGGGLFPQLSGLLELAQAHAKAWSEAHQLMVWGLLCLAQRCGHERQSGPRRDYKIGSRYEVSAPEVPGEPVRQRQSLPAPDAACISARAGEPVEIQAVSQAGSHRQAVACGSASTLSARFWSAQAAAHGRLRHGRRSGWAKAG